MACTNYTVGIVILLSFAVDWFKTGTGIIWVSLCEPGINEAAKYSTNIVRTMVLRVGEEIILVH